MGRNWWNCANFEVVCWWKDILCVCLFVIVLCCICKFIFCPLEFSFLFPPWVRALFLFAQLRRGLTWRCLGPFGLFVCVSVNMSFLLYEEVQEQIMSTGWKSFLCWSSFSFFARQSSKGLTWGCPEPFGLGKSDQCWLPPQDGHLTDPPRWSHILLFIFSRGWIGDQQSDRPLRQ